MLQYWLPLCPLIIAAVCVIVSPMFSVSMLMLIYACSFLYGNIKLDAMNRSQMFIIVRYSGSFSVVDVITFFGTCHILCGNVNVCFE